MKRVLVSNIMMLKERERFDSAIREMGYEPIFPQVDQFLTEQELVEMVLDYEGWLAGDDQITRTVLERALPELQVIAKWGTGLDSIDLNAAKELGIPVLNSPGAFRDAVSEVAIAYMLNLSRHVSLIDRSVRKAAWPKIAGGGLVGKTVGIVGFGAIGQGVAERAVGMKMKVIAHDKFMSKSPDEFSHVRMKSLDELLGEADFVCLCCNLMPDNVHMINSGAIAKMKKDAFLINVARGPLVDERALIEALKRGDLAGAGLDVFEVEPLSNDNELLGFDSVILGSHNANNSIAATQYVHENTLRNLKSVLK